MFQCPYLTACISLDLRRGDRRSSRGSGHAQELGLKLWRIPMGQKKAASTWSSRPAHVLPHASPWAHAAAAASIPNKRSLKNELLVFHHNIFHQDLKDEQSSGLSVSRMFSLFRKYREEVECLFWRDRIRMKPTWLFGLTMKNNYALRAKHWRALRKTHIVWTNYSSRQL